MIWAIILLNILSISCVLSLQKYLNFQKCNRTNNSNFNDCVSKAIRDILPQLNKPIPELSISTMEPLAIPFLSTKNLTGFKQKFKNLKIFGTTTPEQIEAKVDFDKHIINILMEMSEVLVEFDYEIKGKVHLFPLFAKGLGNFDISQTNNITFKYESYYKNEKEYYKIQELRVRIIPKDLYINIKDVIKNFVISEAINSLYNDNWKLIWADIEDSYEEGYRRVYKAILESFFEKFAVDDLLTQ